MEFLGRIQAAARFARRILRTGRGLSPSPDLQVDASISAKDAQTAASLDYFRAIKNMYTGRRGFVIGNGPSLRLTDLDRLSAEITIASNKVFLAYARTAWRPTLYTIADPLVWAKEHSTLDQHQPIVLVPSYLDVAGTSRLDVKTFRHLGSAADAKESEPIPFSNDACVGLYGGHTVTFENLQLAVHLGLNPIYLVGCDHYYAGEKDIKKDTAVEAGAEQNHFLPNYRSPGEVVNPAPIAEMTRSYERARRFGRSNGIEILNATRGGHLETFPRVAFDALF